MTPTLSAGFKRGARVSRVVDAKTNSFRGSNVYAPRILGGISGFSATVADGSFGIDLSRKRRDERPNSPRRRTKALVRLRDDLHLVALEHAPNVAAWYYRAEEFQIPDRPMTACAMCSNRYSLL